MLDRLYADLADGDLRLVKLTEAHREDLRAVCAADADVWAIYSSSFGPDHFDKSFDTLIGGSGRMPYAIMDGDRLVGMTAWLRPDMSAQTVEIGNSFIHPDARGTGFNGRVKRLSSLSRSDGEGDRRRRRWWRGRDVAPLPLRQRFALPPPHAFGTGRIRQHDPQLAGRPRSRHLDRGPPRRMVLWQLRRPLPRRRFRAGDRRRNARRRAARQIRLDHRPRRAVHALVLRDLGAAAIEGRAEGRARSRKGRAKLTVFNPRFLVCRILRTIRFHLT
jgi:hypothetical protein